MENMQVRHQKKKKKTPLRESNPKRSYFAAAELIAAKHAVGQGLIHRSEQLFAEGFFILLCWGLSEANSY